MITILALVPPNDAVGSYDEQYFAIQNFCNIKIDNGFGHFKDHFIRKLHGNTLTHSLQLLPFTLWTAKAKQHLSKKKRNSGVILSWYYHHYHNILSI